MIQSGALTTQDLQDLPLTSDPTFASMNMSTVAAVKEQEFDIVISSGVRSNSNGDLGFTKEPARASVLIR